MFEDWDKLECPGGGGQGRWMAFKECLEEEEGGKCGGDGDDYGCREKVERLCEERVC